MTKQSFFSFCLSDFRVSPDYPFDEDFETAVLRHWDNRKWFAIVMQVSRRKFGFDSDETVEVVNLKLPVEMFGSFGKAEGVYPAYHMNKEYWITAALDGSVPESDIKMLLDISFCETAKRKAVKKPSRNERRPDRFL